MTQYTDAQKEAAANELADAYRKAEARLNGLAEKITELAPVVGAGYLTTISVAAKVHTALGLVADSHLQISPFDPRPHTEDGGAGK